MYTLITKLPTRMYRQFVTYRSGQTQKFQHIHFAHVHCWMLSFYRAIEQGNHAILRGKIAKQATRPCQPYWSIIASPKQNSMWKYVYNIRGCLHYDDFSYVTLDTLALQFTIINQIFGNHLSYVLAQLTIANGLWCTGVYPIWLAFFRTVCWKYN